MAVSLDPAAAPSHLLTKCGSFLHVRESGASKRIPVHPTRCVTFAKASPPHGPCLQSIARLSDSALSGSLVPSCRSSWAGAACRWGASPLLLIYPQSDAAKPFTQLGRRSRASSGLTAAFIQAVLNNVPSFMHAARYSEEYLSNIG